MLDAPPVCPEIASNQVLCGLPPYFLIVAFDMAVAGKPVSQGRSSAQARGARSHPQPAARLTTPPGNSLPSRPIREPEPRLSRPDTSLIDDARPGAHGVWIPNIEGRVP